MNRKRTIWLLLSSALVCSIILSYYVHSDLALALPRKPYSKTLVQMLEELKDEIKTLKTEAFVNPKIAEQFQKALLAKIDAVISNVKAGAHLGGMNKLENDIKKRVEQGINEPWKTELLLKIDLIKDVFANYV